MQKGEIMAELNIEENIIIDDIDKLMEHLEILSGDKNVNINEIVEFIKKEKYTKFYFDKHFKSVDSNDKTVRYLWLDTGYKSEKEEPIFLSFAKTEEKFIGHFCGNTHFLVKKFIESGFFGNHRSISTNKKFFKQKYQRKIEARNTNITESNQTIEKAPVYETALSQYIREDDIELNKEIYLEKNDYSKRKYWNSNLLKITEEIYEMLLINNWNSKNGLDRYIKIIGTRIVQLLSKNSDEYYIINNLKSVIINTGLLDKFGFDIKVLYRQNITYGFYVPYKVLGSKQDYMEEGFTKEQIAKEILPISFFDNGQRTFNPTIEDFDINIRSLYHIIEERRDRLPESVKEVSEAWLATKINNELEIGLKIQQRDPNYAKPCYSTKTGHISWMLPLRLNSELNEEPELVLVIRKAKDFWEIKTILPYDDEIKDKQMCLSLYSHLW